MVSAVKDPIYVESGKRGAERRWADPATRKVVRIDSLTPEERAVVLALVAAKKSATATNGDALEVRSESTTSTPTS